MDFLYSVFFGAGVAGFVYTHMVKRTGAGNTGDISLITGVVFLICTIVFYSIFKLFLNS